MIDLAYLILVGIILWFVISERKRKRIDPELRFILTQTQAQVESKNAKEILAWEQETARLAEINVENTEPKPEGDYFELVWTPTRLDLDEIGEHSKFMGIGGCTLVRKYSGEHLVIKTNFKEFDEMFLKYQALRDD